LVEAVRTGRFNTQPLELADQVFLCLVLALAAGIAALVLIVGDLLHRVPPRDPVEVLRRLSGTGDDDQQ